MDSDQPQDVLRNGREQIDDNAHEREVMLQRRSEGVGDGLAALAAASITELRRHCPDGA